MSDANGTRLNKWISETGICSRREADKLIADGAVKVNGAVAEMGVRVGPDDRVEVRGKPLGKKPDRVYLAYHKPVGVTCTTERKVRSNIVDAVGYSQRIFPVGRLDRPSEGLILLTNDGDIVNKILRAGNEHEKEYIVTLAERFDDAFLQQMRSGVPILDTVTKPCVAERISGRTLRIVLTQGLNRQIRRMAEYLGHEVVTLKRVRIMHIALGDLAVGEYRQLAGKELAVLERVLSHSIKTEEASRPPVVQQRPSKARSPRGAKAKTAEKRGKPGFRARKR
ncbi:23S rRNA pseudouridine synthase F [Aliidiomarina sedimenti]|uniref:Pseudouridine synthase n=1 Tax=Aliidiomarina sedimenti TaxID=1933879 RepID=A0ABY0C123_9GAMM|nr:pseudouridine synthase [Aliidiomarina sedimenti]RUO30873.1 23S rRNA pseudouridine synthase F [Aliidiomarina sedimenti]